MAYRTTLIDSREGVNLTVQEAKAMASVIAPLLKQGQSPYQIVTNHPELGISEKTLYNYIENDVFHEIAGITVLDLRRQVSRKISKSKSKGYKKRVDRKYLQGRTYKDYKEYISENPNVFVTQMDTVYNDETNGPFIPVSYTHLDVYKRQSLDLLENALESAMKQLKIINKEKYNPNKNKR